MHILTARVGGLEGLYEQLQQQILDLKSKQKTEVTTPDNTLSHRVERLEWQETHHTATLTKLDNEYVALTGEIKTLQSSSTDVATTTDNLPPLPWSSMALLQRKVEQMNVQLGQLDQELKNKQIIPDDVITISNLDDKLLSGPILRQVADILTARMGGKARLATALINAASHVEEATNDGVQLALGNLMDELQHMDTETYDFEGTPEQQFIALIRFMNSKILWLTDKVDKVEWTLPVQSDAPSEEGHRTKRQIQEAGQIVAMVNQIKQWYEDYDTYWMGHLKY